MDNAKNMNGEDAADRLKITIASIGSDYRMYLQSMDSIVPFEDRSLFFDPDILEALVWILI